MVLAGLLVLVLALGVTGVAQQTAMAIDRYNAFLSSGAATTVIRSPGGVDAERCDWLNGVAGVVGAAALRERPEGITLAALPSFAQPRIQAVGDVLAVLGSTSATGPGVLLSESLAMKLGIEPGDVLALDPGETVLSGVFPYPDDGRLPLLASAVVEPIPSSGERFDQCWVTLWPPSEKHRSLPLTAVIPIEGQSIETQLLNQSLGEPRSLDALVAASPAGWMRATAVLLAILLGTVWVRSRRVELALALHLGQSRAALNAQTLAELVVVIGAIIPAAFVATAVALASRLGSDHLAGVVLGAGATSLAIVAALAAGVLIGLAFVHEGKMSDWARDR